MDQMNQNQNQNPAPTPNFNNQAPNFGGQIPPQMPQQPQKGGAGLGIASMVLGILSIVFSCCFYYIAFPCGIVGLILGAVSIKKGNAGKGMAITGVVLSIISLALAVVAAIILASAGGSMLEYLEDMSL
jgi:hypothetical protein